MKRKSKAKKKPIKRKKGKSTKKTETEPEEQSQSTSQEEEPSKTLAEGESSEKRNYEDLWQQVFPVGSEVDYPLLQLDDLHMVYQHKWKFLNLEEAFEEGGKLYGKKVYLFGSIESQSVPYQGQKEVTSIPVVVAVVSPVPPSDKLAVDDTVMPMKQMKMDWIPYIPLDKRDAQAERLKTKIFILGCIQGRIKPKRVKKFEACLPYFSQPLKEPEQITHVEDTFPAEPEGVVFKFDLKSDKEEFTDNLIEENELPEDQKDAFMKYLKKKVREANKANRKAKEAWEKDRKLLLNEEEKAEYENMKFYKIYPIFSPDTPDVSRVKTSLINKYYGDAHEML